MGMYQLKLTCTQHIVDTHHGRRCWTRDFTNLNDRVEREISRWLPGLWINNFLSDLYPRIVLRVLVNQYISDNRGSFNRPVMPEGEGELKPSWYRWVIGSTASPLIYRCTMHVLYDPIVSISIMFSSVAYSSLLLFADLLTIHHCQLPLGKTRLTRFSCE